ncbi:hypothetical protein A8C56_08005 [Niabella ginsenosidivorans]|uniref:Acetyltransferase n=1 Tax=Niabella ginsenosidivorans TaxID=1176587 RepID=A0A1A9I0A9_9BACT|nr:acyltransferase [Niabella ginsenosidivorans]ANH80933.1 hypothetical protein A8C56_08005 [Niabella ginsenosidivorans]
MDKIWNGKLSGLISTLLVLVEIILGKIFNKISTILFISNIKKAGENVSIIRGISYRFPKNIEMESNITIGKNTSFFAENIPSKGLLIQDGVSIGGYCHIDFSGGIIIKKDAHIAHRVSISTHDHGYDYKNPPVGKSLEIGEGAFIGSDSCILHNVSVIGKKAVIGTGAIVTKDVPDYAVVAGNPARIIKYITVNK